MSFCSFFFFFSLEETDQETSAARFAAKCMFIKSLEKVDNAGEREEVEVQASLGGVEDALPFRAPRSFTGLEGPPLVACAAASTT